MSYCLQALQLFEGMEHQRFMAVLSEAAGRGPLSLKHVRLGSSCKRLHKIYNQRLCS